MRLPPFFALAALEAAARHRSYSRAADELSVTHGAVSQQIRKLEAELGARLFERRGNSMIPTPAAARLATETGRALGLLREGVAAFAGQAANDPLMISVDPQIASRWLPPRLVRLVRDPAGAHLDFRVEERLADFTTDGIDVGLRYGGGAYPGLESRLLVRETLFPVCSPDFAARHPMADPADLAQTPLLHHRHHTWRSWFIAQNLGAPPREGLAFDDSLMLLEAAAQGLGVALGRSTLVDQDLATGRLVRPVAGEVASDRDIHVVWRADSRKLARITALRDWLADETGSRQD